MANLLPGDGCQARRGLADGNRRQASSRMLRTLDWRTGQGKLWGRQASVCCLGTAKQRLEVAPQNRAYIGIEHGGAYPVVEPD